MVKGMVDAGQLHVARVRQELEGQVYLCVRHEAAGRVGLEEEDGAADLRQEGIGRVARCDLVESLEECSQRIRVDLV